MVYSLMSQMPLDWLPVGLRAQVLRLLTSPRVWRAYRDEVARLGLPVSRHAPRLLPTTSPTDLTPEMWAAAVEELLTACHLRVVAQFDHRTDCLHYVTVPLREGDTQPTLETVAELQSVSPLVCALPPDLTPDGSVDLVDLVDLAALETQPMPAVTPPAVTPLEPAQTTPPTERRPQSGGPTFGWLRMSDLVDEATRAHVRALLAAKLAVGHGAAVETPDTTADVTPTDDTGDARDTGDTSDTSETEEREVVQPC